MSAIVKPPACAPQAKSVSAADLLAGAAKEGQVQQPPDLRRRSRLRSRHPLARPERQVRGDRARAGPGPRSGAGRDPPLARDAPGAKAHEATVVVETPTGALRVSFQHRYTKLALDREEHLRELLGEDYERYFKRTVSLKVKKEGAEDRERLDAMVLDLAEAPGAENFA